MNTDTPTPEQMLANPEFKQALANLMNEWVRCMAIQIGKGLSHDQAAAIVGAQMTAWFERTK